MVNEEQRQITVTFGPEGNVQSAVLADGQAVEGRALICVRERFNRAGWREISTSATVPLDVSMAISAALPPVFEAIRTRDHDGLRRLVEHTHAVTQTVIMAPVWLEGIDMRGGVPSLIALQHGVTALHFAVSKNDPIAVKILLAAGADPITTTNDGISPLDLARRLDYREIEMLLRRRIP